MAVLCDDAGDRGFHLPCQKTPDTLPEIADVSLGDAVLLMARRGRYLNRKNEAPPDHQVVWNGYFRLSVGAQTLERSIRQGDLSARKKRLVQKKNDQWAGGGLVMPESVRYRIRSGVEQTNVRQVRIRKYAKVFSHLMFGLLALTVDQLIRLAIPL